MVIQIKAGFFRKDNLIPISPPGSVFMSPLQTQPSMVAVRRILYKGILACSLGHQSLPPTNLGRVDEKIASPSGRLSQPPCGPVRRLNLTVVRNSSIIQLHPRDVILEKDWGKMVAREASLHIEEHVTWLGKGVVRCYPVGKKGIGHSRQKKSVICHGISSTYHWEDIS
ncbi:hypothetical protein TNCV_2600941 [Trichonephila clavipes]|nr:hypothetical protein TNCV_2600941 [Trichonephila clavipes]